MSSTNFNGTVQQKLSTSSSVKKLVAPTSSANESTTSKRKNHKKARALTSSSVPTTVLLNDKPVVVNNKRIYEPDCWKSENETDPLAGGEFLRTLSRENHIYRKQYQDFKRNHRIARQLYTEVCVKVNVPVSLDLRKKSSESMRNNIKCFIANHQEDFMKLKFPGHAAIEWRIEQIYKHMLTYRKTIRKEAARDGKVSVAKTVGEANSGLICMQLYGCLEPTLPGTSESEMVRFGTGRPWKCVKFQKVDIWSVEVLEINTELAAAVYVPSPKNSPLHERDTRTLRLGDMVEIPAYCVRIVSTDEDDTPAESEDGAPAESEDGAPVESDAPETDDEEIEFVQPRAFDRQNQPFAVRTPLQPLSAPFVNRNLNMFQNKEPRETSSPAEDKRMKKKAKSVTSFYH